MNTDECNCMWVVYFARSRLQNTYRYKRRKFTYRPWGLSRGSSSL